MDRFSDDVDLKLILSKVAGQPLLWSRFLNQLIQQLSCDSCALLVTELMDHGKTHFLFSTGIGQEYQEQYESKLNKLDCFNHYLSKNPYCVIYNQTFNAAQKEAVKNDFIPPQNQQYRFGVSIPCHHKYALNLLINRKSAFDEDLQQRVMQVLQGIIPALEEAIHAEQRYKINSQLFHYLGGHFDGYIIVDQKLNIIFSDPVFIAIIAQMDCVTISDNRFGMKIPCLEQKLLALIENHQEAVIHNQCHSCQIMLIPIATLKNLYQWECFKDGFILTFTHEKDKNSTLERLIEIYHLSRCEAICALNFMHIPSIADIAENTFRSQETVRNHIKHAMQKMDVHNQAEFMKKLITLASL